MGKTLRKIIRNFIFLPITIIGIIYIPAGLVQDNYYMVTTGVVFLLIFVGWDKKNNFKILGWISGRGKRVVGKGPYTMDQVINQVLSGKGESDDVLSDLSEKKYQELIGTESTIISKDIFLFPLAYEVKTKTDIAYSGMRGVLDVQAWNSAVEQYHNNLAINNARRNEHKADMREYERNIQTYQLAQQTRRQTIGRAKKEGKNLAFLLTMGDKKPKEPELKLMDAKKPDEEDYKKYTDKINGHTSFDDWKNKTSRKFSTREFTEHEFNNSHNIEKFKDTFGSLVNSYMQIHSDYAELITRIVVGNEEKVLAEIKEKYSGVEGLDTLIKDFGNMNKGIKNLEARAEKISLLEEDVDKFNKGTSKRRSVNLHERSTLDSKVVNNCIRTIQNQNITEENAEIEDIRDIRLKVAEFTLPSKERLKDVDLEFTGFLYRVIATTYLPLQLIEYSDKEGEKDIKVLDFRTKKIIEINEIDRNKPGFFIDKKKDEYKIFTPTAS